MTPYGSGHYARRERVYLTDAEAKFLLMSLYTERQKVPDSSIINGLVAKLEKRVSA